MQISDISLEMELNGVKNEDIALIIEACKKRGFDNNTLDDELAKHGYDSIFGVDYDAYDNWEDSDYASVERFPYRASSRDYMD